MSAPYPTDSVSSARHQMDAYVATGPKARLTQEQIDSIAAAAKEIDSPKPTPENRSGAQVMITFIVTKATFIPVLFFLVLPKKAFEMIGPHLKAAANQLKLNITNMMAGLAQNITKLFKPLQTMTNGIQKAITNAFQKSLDAFKAVQKALSIAMAKIASPMVAAYKQIVQNLAKLTARTEQMKEYISKLFGARSASEKHLWSKLVKMTEPLSQALERQLHKLARKIETKLKTVKEKILDPLKHVAETVAQKIHESAAAVVVQLEVVFTPLINLAVTASLAAKELVEGQLKNIARVARAVAGQVRQVMRSVSRAVYNAYQEFLKKRLFDPLMASMSAGWGRVAPVLQRVSGSILDWFSRLLRKIRAYLQRMMGKVKIIVDAIKDWATRKWKRDWQPVLKEIPGKIKDISKQVMRISVTIFWALTWGVKQLALLFFEVARNFVRMVKEAFKEVAVQSGIQK